MGFVVRDYLAVSPLPYVSKELNFHLWQNQFFFNSAFYESPTIHIGRRINYNFAYIDQAKIIVTYSPEMLARYPILSNNASTTAAIFRYLADHPRFNLEALITVGGMPAIDVYSPRRHQTGKVSRWKYPQAVRSKIFQSKKLVSYRFGDDLTMAQFKQVD